MEKFPCSIDLKFEHILVTIEVTIDLEFMTIVELMGSQAKPRKGNMHVGQLTLDQFSGAYFPLAQMKT